MCRHTNIDLCIQKDRKTSAYIHNDIYLRYTFGNLDWTSQEWNTDVLRNRRLLGPSLNGLRFAVAQIRLQVLGMSERLQCTT